LSKVLKTKLNLQRAVKATPRGKKKKKKQLKGTPGTDLLGKVRKKKLPKEGRVLKWHEGEGSPEGGENAGRHHPSRETHGNAKEGSDISRIKEEQFPPPYEYWAHRKNKGGQTTAKGKHGIRSQQKLV